MAVYRCPACGDTVRKEAKRCWTCGTVFDMDHEPVLDDGSGKPESLKKKQKRTMIIAAVVIMLVFVGVILWAIGNGNYFFEHYRHWHP
ncbi:MAG: hypothetical protein IKN89_02015 [Oscillospiraceae bacterium]|nr:hypothetical protein [Oscillospiraceae bacterium]